MRPVSRILHPAAAMMPLLLAPASPALGAPDSGFGGGRGGGNGSVGYSGFASPGNGGGRGSPGSHTGVPLDAASAAFLFVLFLLVLLLLNRTIERLRSKRLTPQRLVHLAVLVAGDDRLREKLERCRRSANDASGPETRGRALCDFVRQIDCKSVRAGFVALTRETARTPAAQRQLGLRAEEMARRQARCIGLPSKPRSADAAETPADTPILAACVATVPALLLTGLKTGGQKEAVRLLDRLHDSRGRLRSEAVYLFYTSAADEALPERRLRALLARLRQSAESD